MSTPWPLDLKPNWRLPSDLGFTPGTEPDPYMLGDVWVNRHSDGPSTEYITVEGNPSPQVLIGDELLRDLLFDYRRHNTCAWVELKDPNYGQHVKSECPSCEPIETQERVVRRSQTTTQHVTLSYRRRVTQ